MDTKTEVTQTCLLFWKAVSLLETSALLFANPLKYRLVWKLIQTLFQTQAGMKEIVEVFREKLREELTAVLWAMQ